MKNILQKNMTHIMIILSLCCGLNTTGWAAGQEQEFQTLELVRTYQTEEEFRSAHPELFPEHAPISERVLEQVIPGPTIKELRFTAEEEARLANPGATDPVRKTVFDAWGINGEFFVVAEHELEISYKYEVQAYGPGTPIKQTLYTREGQKVTDLPTDINSIQLSPDKQHFIAYYDGEDVSRHLYFYKSDGTLLHEHELYAYPQVKYSRNGEYVEFLNIFGNEFYIFTKQGDVVFKGDIRNYNPNTNLNTLFVSNNGELILLGTDHSIILIDHEGKKLWDKPSSYIQSVSFQLDKDILIIACVNVEKDHIGTEDPYMVTAVSLSTGERVGEIIKDVSSVYLEPHNMYIKRKGAYDEYSIQ